MSLKYHGLRYLSPERAEFHFGMEKLIGSCQSWLLPVDGNTPKSVRKTVKRFHNRDYWQCAAKCKRTVHNMIKAAQHIAEYMYYMEHQDEYLFEGASMETAAPFLQATDNVPYHLDAFMIHIRILADCLAFAVPFFYAENRKSIAWRSFRDHRKWFVETSPDFDPEYRKLLEKRTEWFDTLAGKTPKGIRDRTVHAPFFATYQLGAEVSADGRRRAVVHMVDSKGFVDNNLTFTLSEMVADFFHFLDGMYQHFGGRVLDELSPLFDKGLEALSVFMTIEGGEDLQQKYRIYPVIHSHVAD